MNFYTPSEELALERHAAIKQVNVAKHADRLASAAVLLRITLGASPNSYKGWEKHLESAKKDIAEIEKRAKK